MNPQLTRRRLLKAGSAILALPWLESLAPAQEKAPPKRIISVCTSFGLYGPAFFPTKPGKDYEASEYLKVLGDLREQFTVFSVAITPQKHASSQVPGTRRDLVSETRCHLMWSPHSVSQARRGSR